MVTYSSIKKLHKLNLKLDRQKKELKYLEGGKAANDLDLKIKLNALKALRIQSQLEEEISYFCGHNGEIQNILCYSFINGLDKIEVALLLGVPEDKVYQSIKAFMSNQSAIL